MEPPLAFQAGGAAAGGKGIEPARILVVDDVEENRDLLEMFLGSRGYSVRCSPSGQDAIRQLSESPFDLVLLDIMMPGMTGIEVLAWIRGEHPASDLPVIMATALNHSQDVVSALERGANDYVAKPIDLPVVLARVRTQLALLQAKRSIARLAGELEARNRFIRSVFGRYLADDVVESLLASPGALRLGGDRRTITILMSDLRGFATLSERLPPEQVVRMLNAYLAAMVEVILEHRGTIDEFIGDAILVLFGAPVLRSDDAARAVACAIAMQLAMAEVNDRLRKEGLPPVEMGIAVHTDEVVVGNIGSDRRAKYGVVGSGVNLTARIESHTVGGQVLISEATRLAAGASLALGREHTIHPRGFAEPVLVHDVRAAAGRSLAAETDEMTTLASPILARFVLLEEKRRVGARVEGHLVRLSPRSAELRPGTGLEVLGSLALRLVDEHGDELAEPVYAKVIEAEDRGASVRLRFTAVPPAALALFERHLGATPS